MRTMLLSGVLAMMLLDGCTAKLTEPEIDFKPPEYVEQMPAFRGERENLGAGSIFGRGENPLFSDHKAMHVNDIVTVSITETAQSSNSAKKQLSEADASTLGGGTFANPGGNSALSSWMGRANGLTDVGFTTDSSSSYAGQGSYSKDASFTTTVSARIIKVLENGNYYINGRREILIDDEKQVIQISGVIRPYDIDQNNNIASSQMSNAKIMYSSEGDIDRSTKQGWGTKLVQAVWPF